MKDIFNSLRTWVEVDLDALKSNLDEVKKSLPQNTKILAVVKANAYGHGAVRVAKYLENMVDYLAIAAPDEAIELRKNDVNCPILILGHIPCGDYDNLIKYNITGTVSDFKEAERMSYSAVKGNTVAKLHIAVDTGMSRIGFQVNEESVEQIKKICNLPNIFVEGIFSHYAAADESDKTYTIMQTEAFDRFISMLEKENIKIPVKHMYNSAGIADLPAKYDMVRQGIILYGLNPSSEVEYKNIVRPRPVMSMKTHVVHIKTLPEGVSVSYGCTYKTKAPTRVATLCAGYADGVPRVLSNNGEVLIRGKYAPIIGRVCMDQFMVDVTDIPEAQNGDVATIFGSDGIRSIDVEAIARKANTIPYEIICNINSRVVRIYKKNGAIEGAFSYLPME